MTLSTLPPSLYRHDTLQKRLFSKWTKKNPFQHSRMVMAAATEKVIRHNPNSQIHSEDLTADEFASIAGIKIRCAEPELEDMHSFTTGATPQHSGAAMVRSQSMQSNQSKLAIWDSEFWREAKQHAHQNSAATPGVPLRFSSSSSGGSTFSDSSASTMATVDTLSHSPSSPSCHRGCSVIRKGRFHIVVGQDDEAASDAEPLVPEEGTVVEWRRKRTYTG